LAIGLHGWMNRNVDAASGFSGMLQLGTKFHTQLLQDDFPVLKQQPLGNLEGFEHAHGQSCIATGAHSFCNPVPLIGNALRAFGYMPTGQL
jgi:hypothetical protein